MLAWNMSLKTAWWNLAKTVNISQETYLKIPKGDTPITDEIVDTLRKKYCINPAWLLNVGRMCVLGLGTTVIGFYFGQKNCMTLAEIRKQTFF
jgi:hypothetical protein